MITFSLKLHKIFGSDMVFQRNVNNTIYGHGQRAGNTVSLQIENARFTAIVQQDLAFTISFPSHDSSKGYTFVVSETNGQTVQLTNVMFGFVFFLIKEKFTFVLDNQTWTGLFQDLQIQN
jgi:hypothetical protein